MNLGQKTFAIVFLTVAGLMVMLYAVNRSLLLHVYLEIEQVETRRAVARVESVIDDELVNLSRTTNDYAAWDQTYRFLKDRSPQYIDHEFKNETLQGLNVDAVLLTDTSGKIVFFKMSDLSLENGISTPTKPLLLLAADRWVQGAASASTARSGILLLPQGPVLIAAAPILTTERKGPARGAFLVMRNLNQSFLQNLRRTTLAAVSFRMASDPDLPADFRMALHSLAANSKVTYLRPLSDTTVSGYALLNDVHGSPALVLRVDSPRAVFQSGLSSLRYLAWALCTASLVFGLTTLLLLRETVLTRLTDLSNKVSRIGEQETLSQRIEVEGHDEIAQLGAEINRMLEALEKSSRLEKMNQILRQEVYDRMLTEKAREETARLTALSARIGAALTKAGSMKLGMQTCTEAFEEHLGGAWTGVWVAREGSAVLHLVASSGLGACDTSKFASAVAMNIGSIADSHNPYLTNDFLHEPQTERDAIEQARIVSFLGYPLIVEGHVVGVAAALACAPFARTALDSFASVGDQLAQFIRRMHVQEALHASEEHFRQLFATIPLPVWLRELSQGCFLEVNEAAVKRYGYSRDEFLRMTIADLRSGEDGRHPDEDSASRRNDIPFPRKHRTKNGQVLDVEVYAHPVEFTGVPALLVTVLDITERNQMEVELRHGQKLQAVGGLAAGIAHEINTPIQFVGDNVRFLRDVFPGMSMLLEKYEAMYAALKKGPPGSQALQELDQAREKANVDLLCSEIPQALDHTLDGIERVATIVQALKVFSHVDSGREMKAANLNFALASTLEVARNELRYVAEIEIVFGQIPLVMCHLGDLNQVFLNLLVNAAHSIGDALKESGNKGRIRIETKIEKRFGGDWVMVAISDSGTGIPDAIKPRIFEPFFTTKQVGKGTGQGLALARAIVVERHSGSLTFESIPGQGATFYVRIPVNGSAVAARAHAASSS